MPSDLLVPLLQTGKGPVCASPRALQNRRDFEQPDRTRIHEEEVWKYVSAADYYRGCSGGRGIVRVCRHDLWPGRRVYAPPNHRQKTPTVEIAEGIAHRRRLRILARRLKPIYSVNAIFGKDRYCGDPWRTSSPLRPGLGFRYTQARVRGSFRRLGRSASAPIPASLCSLLQRHPNALVLG